MNELVIYILTSLIALSAGVTFGLSPVSTFKALSYASGLLATAAVVTVAFILGVSAPWMAPTFALIAAFTSLFVAAAARAGEPGLVGEPYWRRVVLITFHNGRLRTVEGDTTSTS